MLYAYKCSNLECQHQHEELKKVDERFTDTCPKCGSESQLQLSTAALHFRGEGFYVNDYKKAAGKPKDYEFAGTY